MEAWGCEGDGGWSEDVGQGWHCARVIRQYRLLFSWLGDMWRRLIWAGDKDCSCEMVRGREGV
ncbi:hypothetical protein WN944_011310 [Citrus x changshan-huyou]|uniref:Uncharacterized protein n=1 Tax=Citrus x changshan-huyou TaxID=2935761 RepID=A0AAP0MT59_9ROSI